MVMIVGGGGSSHRDHQGMPAEAPERARSTQAKDSFFGLRGESLAFRVMFTWLFEISVVPRMRRVLRLEKAVLAICAVFRGERRYLVEWLTYHLFLGVGHIFLYSNECGEEVERARAVLQPFVLAGSVTLNETFVCSTAGFQAAAYALNYRRHRHLASWWAHIDVDEVTLCHAMPRNASLPKIDWLASTRRLTG